MERKEVGRGGGEERVEDRRRWYKYMKEVGREEEKE